MGPENYDSPRTFEHARLLIGGLSLLASLCSIYTAKSYPRRTLLVYGHVFICASLICLAVSSLQKQAVFALASYSLFLISYQTTIGCITWLYCSEIAVDVALSSAVALEYTIVCISTSLFSHITNNYGELTISLKPVHVFSILASLSLMAALWACKCIKETKYINDKKRKTLFSTIKL
jgi:hypothetical protein